MAVKIEIDGSIKRISSRDYIFDVQELTEIFPEGYQFIDMGLFIVIAHTEDKISRMNKVASLFLRYPVYGEILMVSGKELGDTSYVTTENSKYSPKESDDGIINLLQETLITFKAVTEEEDDYMGYQTTGNVSKKQSNLKKQLLTIDPKKLLKESKSNEDEMFIDNFYKSAVTKLKKTKENLNAIILYEESEFFIKFAEGRVIETLKAMLTHCTNIEDFEKCAVLRDTVENNKNVDAPKLEIEKLNIFENGEFKNIEEEDEEDL